MSEFKFHAGRVFAEDISAAAEFYSKVLGLTEILRMSFPGIEEVLMNFGGSVPEAAANPGAQFVIMSQPPGAPQDDRAHIVLHSSDVDESIAAFTAAGGTVVFGPEDLNGVRVAFVKDPFGNVIEFLKLPG